MAIAQFDNGILLYIILASSVFMAWGMVRHRDKDDHRTLGEVLRDTAMVAPEMEISEFHPTNEEGPADQGQA